MKKYIVIFLLSITCSFAQDKIITAKSDTILAKITSLENRKVVYYLEADKDKKTLESPFASLHKIIWRNGLEYVIDKGLEEKLKREVKIEDVKKENIIDSKSIIESKKESEKINKYLNAPVLVIKDSFFRRTSYNINGTKVKAIEIENALKIYDAENYANFLRGNNMRKIAIGTVIAANLGNLTINIINDLDYPKRGENLYPNLLGVAVAGYITGIIGDLKMKKAAKNYEINRKKSNNYKEYK